MKKSKQTACGRKQAQACEASDRRFVCFGARFLSRPTSDFRPLPSGFSWSNILDPTAVTVTYTRQYGQLATRATQRGTGPVLTASWTYDPRGLITSLSNSLSASAPPREETISLYTYANDALGRRTAIGRSGTAYSQPLTDQYGYNARSEITSARGSSVGTAFPDRAFDYDYDPIGNRISSTTYSPSNDANTATYTANALNQYSQRTVPGYADVRGTAATNATVTVNDLPVWRYFDLFYGEAPATNTTSPAWTQLAVTAVIPGQTTNVPDTVSSVTGHVYVAQTPESFTYDDDGNMTSDGRFSYSWDAENRLIAVETLSAAVTAGAPKIKVEMAYDHQSRRIAKTVSLWTNGAWQVSTSTAFLYDGWNLLCSLPGGATASAPASTNFFVWGLDLSGTAQGAGGIGGLVAGVVVSPDSLQPTTYLPSYDANGNVMQLTSATNGVVVACYEYDPFGNTVTASGELAEANPFRFSTKYLENETGLYYYGYRFGAETICKWMSRDIIGERGGGNLSAMIFNCSVVRVDYLGLSITKKTCESVVASYEKTPFVGGLKGAPVTVAGLIDPVPIIVMPMPPPCPCLKDITCSCCLFHDSSGSYSPITRSISLCYNHFNTEGELATYIRHELAHAESMCGNAVWNCADCIAEEKQAYRRSGICGSLPEANCNRLITQLAFDSCNTSPITHCKGKWEDYLSVPPANNLPPVPEPSKATTH